MASSQTRDLLITSPTP